MSDPSFPWPTLPLRTLASEMCLGKMLDKQKNRGTLQPYLRNVNVRWFSFDLSDLKEMRFEDGDGSRFDLRPGDLVVCEGGEPGRAAVWRGQSENAKIQKALHRIRFRAEEYEPSFAMYFLYFGTITNHFAPHYTGTTIKHLTGAALSRVQFPVPPLNEQRRIVAKIEELFSDLDAGVAVLKRAKANLKRYRAAVLKAAVEGKLTEEWRAKHPHTEPASKLLTRILTERRQKWEAEQLAKFAAAGKEPPKGWREKYVEPESPDSTGSPSLPVGWSWVSIAQISECLDHMRVPVNKEERATRFGDVPYYGANGQVGYIDDFLFDEPLVLVVEDETFVGREKPFSYLITGKSWVNNHAHILRPTAATTADFLNYGLMYYPFIPLTTGTTARRKLTKQRLMEAPFALPPLTEQQLIASDVAEKFSQIDAAEITIHHSLNRAARLRQSILQQAFEGRLVPQDPQNEPARELLEQLKRDIPARVSSNGIVSRKSPATVRRRPAE